MIVCHCFTVTILWLWSLVNAASGPQRRKSSSLSPVAKRIKLSSISDTVTAPVASDASTSAAAMPVPARVSNMSVKQGRTYPTDLDAMVKEFCEDKANKEFIRCIPASPPGAPGQRRYATEARKNGVVIIARLKSSPKVKISVSVPHLQRELEEEAMTQGILVDIKYQPDVDWYTMRERNEREAGNMDILADMGMGPPRIILSTASGGRLLGDFLIAMQVDYVTPTSIVTTIIETEPSGPATFSAILKVQKALLQHINELHENRLHSCNAELNNFRIRSPSAKLLFVPGRGPKPTAIYPSRLFLMNPGTLQRIEGLRDTPCIFRSTQQIDSLLVNLAGDPDLVEKAGLHGYGGLFLYIKEVFSKIERLVNTGVLMTAGDEYRHNEALQRILSENIDN